MARLSIPDRYLSGVSKIGDLDARMTAEIRKILDSVKMSPEDRLGPIVPAISSLNPSDKDGFRQLGEALRALYAVRVSNDVPLDEFVEDVMAAMDAEDEWRIPADKQNIFRENLHSLLGAELFALRSKVGDLRYEDERIFCCARIITDLRPVFGSNVDEGPKAMVVVHSLKLGFHKSEAEYEEIYISLDAEDLETLKSVVQRASSKAKTLKSVVPNLPIFGLGKQTGGRNG